jgi:hypothetical protein
MLVDKQKVIDILRSRGEDQRADWVDRDLPDRFDPSQHSGLLSTLRIDVAALATATPESAPGS